MPNVPTLTPAQEASAAEVRVFIERNGRDGVVFINGLRGQGKSTIARRAAELLGWQHHDVASYEPKYEQFDEKIAAPGKHLIAMEEHFNDSEMLEGIRLARGKVHGTVVLRQPLNSQAQLLPDECRESGLVTSTVSAPPLTPNEVTAFARNLRASISDDELRILHEYGFGVPLLVEQLINGVCPLTEEHARIACAQYLLRQSNFTTSLPREETFNLLNACVEEHTSRRIPESLRNSEEFIADRSPLRRYDLSCIPHGFPRCPHTLLRYQRWKEAAQSDRDTQLTVFIPRLSWELYDELCEEFGTDVALSFHDGGRVRTLCSMFRKTQVLHEHFGRRFGEGERVEEATEFLNLYLKKNSIGKSRVDWQGKGMLRARKPIITIDDEKNYPFFVYSDDHSVQDQVGIGLAIESHLQHLQMPYQLSLGGAHYDQYDPAGNAYAPLAWEAPYEHLREIPRRF